MKRSMDLYLSIAKAIEDCEHAWLDLDDVAPMDPEQRERFCEHVAMLSEAGLIQWSGGTREGPGPARLTSAGHDFIANAETPGIWERAMEVTGAAVRKVSIDFFAKVLGDLVLEQFRATLAASRQ